MLGGGEETKGGGAKVSERCSGVHLNAAPSYNGVQAAAAQIPVAGQHGHTAQLQGGRGRG